MEELTIKSIKATFKIDSQNAITLIRTGRVNKRSKHIDVRYHFIHEKLMSGKINIKYCLTNKQTADCLPKPLNKAKFETVKNLRMRP